MAGRSKFETTYRHLRRFALASDQQGHAATVRYFDPRVFPILASYLKPPQLAGFFAGIDSVTMESVSGRAAVRYAFENSSLVRTELPLETRNVGA